MAAEDVFPPGSPEAVALGCTCPPPYNDPEGWQTVECVIHAPRYIGEDDEWPWGDDG